MKELTMFYLKSNTCNLKPRCDGFTLIEMLIVIAIGILMLGTAVFYLSGMRSAGQVEDAASRIASLLEAAQEKSAGQESNGHFGVFINNVVPAAASYSLYKADEALLAGGPPYTDPPGEVLERQVLGSGALFTAPASGVTTNIVFARGTGLPNAPATIILLSSRSDVQKTVTVSENGLIEHH